MSDTNANNAASNNANTRLPGHLLSPAEYEQLRARRGRGRWLQILSFLPVIIGLLLIIFVFSTNISSAFSWFAIESQGRGGSSGVLFPTSEVTQDNVVRQELIARGMTDAEVTTFFDDGAAYASYAEDYATSWEGLAAQALETDAANLDNAENFFVAEAANILKAKDTHALSDSAALLGTSDAASEGAMRSSLEQLSTLLSDWGEAEFTQQGSTDADALKDLNKEFKGFRESDLLSDAALLVSPSDVLANTTIGNVLNNTNLQELQALYQQYGTNQAILASNDMGKFVELSQALADSDVFSTLNDEANQQALADAGKPLKKLADNFADLQESLAAFNQGTENSLEPSAQRLLEQILASDNVQTSEAMNQLGNAYTTLSKASKLQQNMQKGLANFAELEHFSVADGTLAITEPESFLSSGRYRAKVVEYYRNNWQAITRVRASNEGISSSDIEAQIAEVADNFTLSDNNTISGFLEWSPLYRYDETLAGTAQDRIDEKLINGREFSQFEDRNRVERVYVPKGEAGAEAGWYWVVHTQRDNIEDQAPYFAGRTGEKHEELLHDAEPDDVNMYMNPQLDWSFLTRKNSQKALMAGFYNAIIGTLWVIGLVIIFSAILGVGAALYLEEYAPKNWFSDFLEVNLRNLAGVPSIVYGILGLYIFVRAIGFGQSVISAALTLTLLILPVVIIASREAIRSVPDSLRQASYGLGATKWQTVSQAVLPNAIPGIVTGVILAVARAIGETAPLLLVGGAGFTAAIPGGWNAIFDSFSVMPLQIYSFYSMPNRNDFLPAAAAGILVLLIILIIIYIAAFIIRARYARD